MKKETTIANSLFEFRSQSGKITGISKQTIQNISSHGGGGMVIDGSGFIAPPRIVATNHSVEEFFLKLKDMEMPVKLYDYALAIRNGHNATLIWGAKVNASNLYLLGLINHDTGYRYEIINNDNLLGMGLIAKKIKIPILLGVFLFLTSIGILLLIANFVRNKMIDSKQKKVTNEIKEELKYIINEFENEFVEKCKLIEMN